MKRELDLILENPNINNNLINSDNNNLRSLELKKRNLILKYQELKNDNDILKNDNNKLENDISLNKQDMQNNFNSSLAFPLNNSDIKINFSSTSQIIEEINFPCKLDELFIDVEKRLYEKYGRKTYDMNNVVLANGKMVNRFKTIYDNKIKNGDKLVINFISDSDLKPNTNC